jgi:peptidyl-tRNA hydrolase
VDGIFERFAPLIQDFIYARGWQSLRGVQEQAARYIFDTDDHLIVCYDDVDLPEGKLRFRPKGSAGTHNGMRNIIYLLGWDDFPRVRVGIGRPPEGWDMKDWVLSGYNTPELRRTMFDAYMGAADVVAELIGSGVEAARQLVGKLNG